MAHVPAFLQNQLLSGHDLTPQLVAVEAERLNKVRLFYREFSPEAPSGIIRQESVEFQPFLFLANPDSLRFAPVPYELERLAGPGPLAYLVHVSGFDTWQLLLRHLKRPAENPAGDKSARPSFYTIPDEATQYLLGTGRTLFKSMQFSDVHRLQLDLETYSTPGYQFPNAEREGDRIIMISMTDNRGWEHCLNGQEMSEREMLESFVHIFKEKDPDIVEGHNLFKFDLPYLEARAKRHGVRLTLGRDHSVPTCHTSRFSIADRVLPYPKYRIFGRHIVDTLFLALLYDVSHRDLESFGLKDIARHFGINAADRTYVDGSDISAVFERDPQRLMAYALDDVRETRALAELLGQSHFYQTQIFPLSYQDTIVRGNATRIDLLFVREYYRQRHALPEYPVGTVYEGGYTEMGIQGILRHVLHCDIQSLYPSIMLTYRIHPRSDSLGIFLPLLRDLRTFRLEAKKLVRSAKTRQEQESAEALQSTFKVLINSFYGYLGFVMGHFADFEAAAAITHKGRELIQEMIRWLEAAGSKVIEVDTDGIYFLAPQQASSQPEQLIEALNSELPAGIEAELDGNYAAMFSYKVKNYVLLDKTGQLKIKGSGLKSRSVEKFQRLFMEEIFSHLLHGNAKELGIRFLEYRDALLNHRWTPAMFCKRETLQDAPSLYQEKLAAGKRSPAAVYQLALHSGRKFEAGDQICYYVAGASAKVKVYEAAKLIEEWRSDAPDENVAYYLEKLGELYRKFESFIVAEGGPALSELESPQQSLFH